MITLSIDYDDDTFDAVLKCNAGGSHWESIRRACQENSDDVKVISSTEFRMPWWAFLNCKAAVGYHASKYNLKIQMSDKAAALLKAINNADLRIKDAANIPVISSDEIGERLKGQLKERELKPYQIRNIGKLARLNVGATFSVPGAGKTTEALAFFTLLKAKTSRLLVIAPKNAFAAWEEQLNFWNLSHAFVRLTGGKHSIEKILKSNPHLMLITYQQFPRVADVIGRYMEKYPESFIFLDESHKIKGGADKVIASSILKVSHLVTNKLVMSGTPLPNSISDLIPQLRFLAPEVNVTAENVKSFLEPMYVRTCKSELNLPKPTRIEVNVPLAPMQRYLYDQLKSEQALQANKFLNSTSRQALRKLGRSAMLLLQFVSNPALLARNDFAYSELLGEVLNEGDSPKVAYACKRARELAAQNKKVIIWSSFVENVEIIAERLSDLGADFIHGGVETNTDIESDSREAKIKRFHDNDKSMVLVANPAACSEGISLHTVCHHAIYVDRNYNAAQFLQSEDRIHRIGQENAPIIEILVCPRTVDDSVAARLQQKIDLMAEVLDDKDLEYKPVSFDLETNDLDRGDIESFLKHLRDTE